MSIMHDSLAPEKRRLMLLGFFTAMPSPAKHCEQALWRMVSHKETADIFMAGTAALSGDMLASDLIICQKLCECSESLRIMSHAQA